ncbi:MAG: toxin HipA [Betaproteobacteria bacterium]|nr:toxin HipA [Betaproteobacteria bacterium]
MARKPAHAPLKVLLNNRLVGHLRKEAGGAVEFTYDEGWIEWEGNLPISLSLPIRKDPYKGEKVIAVFDNLLPDSEQLRRRVAEKVGAAGTDPYSLLAQIGRDCVGALQFLGADDNTEYGSPKIEGEEISGEDIEILLKDLARAPLGLDRDQDFRISVAGAQEKTALLRYEGAWLKPHGTTPTSHLFKTQIGTLQNGLDLSNSVENEYYCLALLRRFGLDVAKAEIKTFGKTKALVVERFDRIWTGDKRLVRLPQEDCCQALSVPSTRKYENDGGPGIVKILKLLQGADSPSDDQLAFLKAQIIFWLIGAVDGHAKNFSIYLLPGGRFGLQPFYDVITAQPSLDKGQVQKKQMKLAMAVGDGRHYKLEEIQPRHYFQTVRQAGLSQTLVELAFSEVSKNAEKALQEVEQDMPKDFPAFIHASVAASVAARLRTFEYVADDESKRRTKVAAKRKADGA